MRIENKATENGENETRRSTKRREKEYNLSKPSVTKEEPIVKKEEKKRQNSCY